MLETRLSACPSDSYIRVSQPGATAEVYTHGDPTPHMKAKLLESEGKIQSRIITEGVFGEVDVQSISRDLQERCGATHVKIDASSERYCTFLRAALY